MVYCYRQWNIRRGSCSWRSLLTQLRPKEICEAMLENMSMSMDHSNRQRRATKRYTSPCWSKNLLSMENLSQSQLFHNGLMSYSMPPSSTWIMSKARPSLLYLGLMNQFYFVLLPDLERCVFIICIYGYLLSLMFLSTDKCSCVDNSQQTCQAP